MITLSIIFILQVNATKMLYAAVRRGDADLVQDIIKKGADVDAESKVQSYANRLFMSTIHFVIFLTADYVFDSVYERSESIHT